MDKTFYDLHIELRNREKHKREIFVRRMLSFETIIMITNLLLNMHNNDYIDIMNIRID